MTRHNARIAANLVVTAAGVAAAYVVMTTPPLRRAAVRAARLWLGAAVPALLVNQAREAWQQSGRRA